MATNHTLILLVDDDEDDRLFLREAIHQHLNGVTVYEAQTGQETLTFLHGRPPKARVDLVMLDINMPGMDGLEVLDKIRSIPTLQPIPTIILSTSNHPELVEEAYKKGINSFIRKPASMSGYEAIVKAIQICFLNGTLK